MTTDPLVAFLNARLDEDEAAAKELAPIWAPSTGAVLLNRPLTGIEVRHIALHDPARVLRDVEAGRAILALHYMISDEYIDGDGIERAAFICHECDNFGRSDNWPCPTLRHLAATWSDHPGYRQEDWKP